MKKLLLLALCGAALLALGCKTPDEIEEDVRSGITTQEIVIKQELEREKRTLTVTGVGTMEIEPDVALVELSVSVQGATAEEAQALNGEVMSAVLLAIKENGILDENIKTRMVAVLPVRGVDKDAGDIVGYTAANTISITIIHVKRTGEIVSAAMQAGANELVSIEFHLQDETEAYREALAKAVEDA
ncbi:MAG: SIMPL domain-containing protein, partial [Clostridiales bacterium]|nr:SIMPL domain-containing protein [Clostridiales bacterium]